MKSTITLHSTAHSNHTSYKNLLHAPMFTLTVKMSLQMFYSNIMAHMPSAYGLGKNIIFNKVQFSSVQFRQQPFLKQPKEENDHRNYFKIDLHEGMGPGQDLTRDPMICNQKCYRMRYSARCLFGLVSLPQGAIILAIVAFPGPIHFIFCVYVISTETFRNFTKDPAVNILKYSYSF